jgi:hypothetical protein
VPKPRKFPWIDSIPKIVYDEYFWVEEEKSTSNEGKSINSRYKTQLKKKKLLYPTNYALREIGHNKKNITTT